MTGSLKVTVPLPPQKPAEFEYKILQLTPAEVEPDEEVTVDGEISNVGEMNGTYSYDLLLDGELVDSATGSLAGGEKTQEKHTVSAAQEGTHIVEVIGEIAVFLVIAPLLHHHLLNHFHGSGSI